MLTLSVQPGDNLGAWGLGSLDPKSWARRRKPAHGRRHLLLQRTALHLLLRCRVWLGAPVALHTCGQVPVSTWAGWVVLEASGGAKWEHTLAALCLIRLAFFPSDAVFTFWVMDCSPQVLVHRGKPSWPGGTVGFHFRFNELDQALRFPLIFR